MTMNVLIVDDHPMVLEYLSSAVGKALPDAVVRTAGDLSSALDLAGDVALDMVLLDLGLPGCGGIDSLIRFRKAHPDVRAVVVSAEDDEASVRGALAAGAAGFIPKSSSPKIVVNALRLVAEGGKYIPPQALGAGSNEVGASSLQVQLTERQRAVMIRMLKGRSNAQIAEELGISEATAKQHAHAVYATFGVSSRSDLILAASSPAAGSG